MGKGSVGSGIDTSCGYVRFRVTYKDERGQSIRRWVALRHLAPTSQNIVYASRLRDQIKAEIRLNTFDPAKYWPDDDPSESKILVQQVAERYFERASATLQRSTMLTYLEIWDTYWGPTIGAMPVVDVKYADIDRIVHSFEFSSSKRFNNVMIPVRAVFQLAMDYDYIDVSPVQKVKSRRNTKKIPDPFTLDEAETILDYLADREPMYHNYFELAFFSGLRTSELLALDWPSIDFNSRLIRVDKALVRRQIKVPKTYDPRDVEMSDRSMDALKRQKPHTYLKYGPVFADEQGKHIYNDQPPRRVFQAALKALGIRQRPAYNTRHTFATMSIMHGQNIHWVAKQLGHRTTAMVLNTYSRWISLADGGRELTKFNEFTSKKENRGAK